MARRKGRGRLSAIERLPREAGHVVAWAADQLRDREKTQLEIYDGFVERLEALMRERRGELEFPIPSFSAFNRHSIQLATLARRLDDTRAIAGAIAERFNAEASDELTLISAEAIKTLVFELLTTAGEAGTTPKDAKYLADALRAAAQAQGVSTLRRQRAEETFEKGVSDAVDKVAKIKGLTAETAEAIKAQILGVKPQEPADE